MLDLSSERKERRFVVHLTAKRIPLFIQTAVHMDMVGPRYSYVFTDAVSFLKKVENSSKLSELPHSQT